MIGRPRISNPFCLSNEILMTFLYFSYPSFYVLSKFVNVNIPLLDKHLPNYFVEDKIPTKNCNLCSAKENPLFSHRLSVLNKFSDTQMANPKGNEYKRVINFYFSETPI